MGTNEEAMKSLVKWTGISELHPHFVVVFNQGKTKDNKINNMKY
jgi:hypothetical protein